jgi:hypothetical protein
VLLLFSFFSVFALSNGIVALADTGTDSLAEETSVIGLGVTLALLVVAGAFLSVRLFEVERRQVYGTDLPEICEIVPGDLLDELTENRLPVDTEHGDCADM